MIKTIEEIQAIMNKNKPNQPLLSPTSISIAQPIQNTSDKLKPKFNREEYDKAYRKSATYKAYQKEYRSREENKEKLRQRYLKKKMEEQSDGTT